MTDYLDEIQARADAATDGPWAADAWEWRVDIDGPDGGWLFRHFDPEDRIADFAQVEADAEFIANARTDIPRLVAEQRDLIRLLDAAREDKTKARRQRSEYRLRAMRAEAALRAVEALHRPVREPMSGETACGFCIETYAWHYPCPTVTAIRDALEAR